MNEAVKNWLRAAIKNEQNDDVRRMLIFQYLWPNRANRGG